MEKIRVAINGFGRIGRLTFFQLLKKKNVEVVAINDLTDPKTLAHLLKYDSVHGIYPCKIHAGENSLFVEGKEYKVFGETNPQKLPWASLAVDLVLEATGKFTSEKGASLHLQAGARKVVISAPAEGNLPTVVVGINEQEINGPAPILSNSSCTTNCLAPMAKVLEDTFGIERGFMTTIHAYTQDQRLHDAPHKDLRRARAAALSIIPTTSGATTAVELVIPSLKGKLGGYSMRVPVPDGSVTDFTVLLKKEVAVATVNEVMKEAAETCFKGIIQYCDEPIVSADIIGNPYSCIFDSLLTQANGRLVKVTGWYDNEFGFSCRLADLIAFGKVHTGCNRMEHPSSPNSCDGEQANVQRHTGS